MRIALDGRALVAPRTGIGWYTYHLLKSFSCLTEKWEADVLINRAVAENFGPQVREEVLRFPNTVRVRPIWEGILLPRRLRFLRPDVWHSPMTVIPEELGEIATVATVHDIAFLLFPEIQPPAYRNYWTDWTRKACERADRIIAVSHSTRKDLLEHFKVDAKKVVVVHEAADPFMFKRSGENEISQARAKFAIPDSFLLFVGTLEPRKNLPFLFQVYRRAQERGIALPALVVAGGKGWLHSDIGHEMAAFGDRIHPIGYLDRISLRALYQSAAAVVVPSKYEGFGLQAAEAMAAGAAVIAADLSSLPEVVGEGGALLPVEDPDPWVDKIGQLVEDSAERNRLQRKALEQASKFSWEKAGRETFGVYREAIGRRG